LNVIISRQLRCIEARRLAAAATGEVYVAEALDLPSLLAAFSAFHCVAGGLAGALFAVRAFTNPANQALRL
jgi:hypothetical protein